MAPVIAIASCRKLEDYRQALLHAGAEVRVVDCSIGVGEALDGVNGLLLTGGGDIAPARYGGAPHPSISEAEPGRDEFELALVAAGRARRMAILAICRGAQVLNVACGGTLVQDIPSEVSGALEHRLEAPPHQPYSLAHEAWLDKETLLWRLMQEQLTGVDACDVNSRHHQAVRRVADGFRVAATAPDGVVEAIEDPSASFCLGVQWHPENFWRTGEFRPLFEGFLAAAGQ